MTPSWGWGASPGLPGSTFPMSPRRDHISNTFFQRMCGQTPAGGEALGMSEEGEGLFAFTRLSSQMVETDPEPGHLDPRHRSGPLGGPQLEGPGQFAEGLYCHFDAFGLHCKYHSPFQLQVEVCAYNIRIQLNGFSQTEHSHGTSPQIKKQKLSYTHFQLLLLFRVTATLTSNDMG